MLSPRQRVWRWAPGFPPEASNRVAVLLNPGDGNGLVELRQSGEAAILCRYLDHIECVRLTYLEPRKDFHWPNPPEYNYVDRHVFAKLKMLNIVPSDLCTDQEFLRRVYLDLCGILPKPDEVLTFLADARPDSRIATTVMWNRP